MGTAQNIRVVITYTYIYIYKYKIYTRTSGMRDMLWNCRFLLRLGIQTYRFVGILLGGVVLRSVVLARVFYVYG